MDFSAFTKIPSRIKRVRRKFSDTGMLTGSFSISYPNKDIAKMCSRIYQYVVPHSKIHIRRGCRVMISCRYDIDFAFLQLFVMAMFSDGDKRKKAIKRFINARYHAELDGIMPRGNELVFNTEIAENQ